MIERTPGDEVPCWITEVETWAIRDAWFWYRSAREAELCLVEDDFEIVGVVGYERVRDGRWYMPGLLVPADQRGRGHGSNLFAAVLHRFANAHPDDTLEWVVSRENEAMTKLCTSSPATNLGQRDLLCGGQPHAYDIWSYAAFADPTLVAALPPT